MDAAESGTPRAAALDSEAALLDAVATEHGLPAAPLRSVVQSARHESSRRRRRLPATELEAFVDGLVGTGG